MTMIHESRPVEVEKGPLPTPNQPFESFEELMLETMSLQKGHSEEHPMPCAGGRIYDLDGDNPAVYPDRTHGDIGAGDRRHMPIHTPLSDQKMISMLGALVAADHTAGIDMILDEEKISIEVALPIEPLVSRFVVNQPEPTPGRLGRPEPTEPLFIDDQLMSGIFGIADRPSNEPVAPEELAPAMTEFQPTHMVSAPEVKAPKKGLFARAAAKLRRTSPATTPVQDWRPGLVDRIRYSPKAQRVLGVVAVAGVMFAGAVTTSLTAAPEAQPVASPQTTTVPWERHAATTSTTIKVNVPAPPSPVKVEGLNLYDPETYMAFGRLDKAIKDIKAQHPDLSEADQYQLLKDLLHAAELDATSKK